MSTTQPQALTQDHLANPTSDKLKKLHTHESTTTTHQLSAHSDEEEQIEASEPDSQLTKVVSESQDEVYNRYSDRKKKLFVYIIALSVFLSPASASIFLPAVSTVAKHFKTTDQVMNISIAVYTLVMSVSPCITSPLGDIYGKRTLYIICTLGYTVSSALVAVSQNLAMFFVFRCTTALFGTAYFSLGGSIVRDIYRPDQRGNAMGITLSGSQISVAFAPVLGGIIVTFTSWRVVFWVLTGLGGLTLVLVVLFLEETSIDLKYKQVKKLHPNKKFVWVPFNPFKVIIAFQYTNLIIGGFMSMALIYNMNCLTTPIPHVVNPRFHLTKPIYAGLFYLAPGMGYLIGSFFGGKWADRYVKKYIKIRGKRIAEDRLRSAIIPFGFVLPISVMIYGWAIDKEKGGMALPIIAMFFNGLAQTFCFPSLNAYCVDCLPHLGGDAIATSYCSRYIAGAIASATCLIQINHIGVGWTNTISAFVLWFGFASCVVLIKYGDAMRNRVLKKLAAKESEKSETEQEEDDKYDEEVAEEEEAAIEKIQ